MISTLLAILFFLLTVTFLILYIICLNKLKKPSQDWLDFLRKGIPNENIVNCIYDKVITETNNNPMKIASLIAEECNGNSDRPNQPSLCKNYINGDAIEEIGKKCWDK